MLHFISYNSIISTEKSVLKEIIMRKNNPDAKDRILKSAIKVFAEKSFEGSRVDEIAREASVPKSLIYYHFKSKDEILEVLVQSFLEEYLELIKVAENDTHQTKEKEMKKRFENLYSGFQERNADLIRIILIDSLKKSNKKPIVFPIVEKMIEMEMKFSINQEGHGYDYRERLVAEFFTDIMPNYAYFCFSETWCDYFNIEKKTLDDIFNNVMVESHGAYHKYHK